MKNYEAEARERWQDGVPCPACGKGDCFIYEGDMIWIT